MVATWEPKTTRPTIHGTKHMVSTGHYTASVAALRILDAGGNATDAGVAAGLCINVVQPDLTNLGGVAPICVYSAESGAVKTLSGLGTWPENVDLGYLERVYAGRIPPGIHRTVVPAALGAWLTALEKYGTMSFAEVAAPAIELAIEGVLVHSVMYDTLSDATALKNIRSWRSTSEIYLDSSGEPLQVGTLLQQRDLGILLERLVEAERDSANREDGIRAAYDRFYRGDIAQEIVEFSKRQGGWISLSDLQNFTVEEENALSVNYRGYDVYGCNAWCQGPVVLQTLNIIEGFELSSYDLDSPDYFHLITESLKASFADRERYYGDPRFRSVPTDALLSKSYADEWRQRIDYRRASSGMPAPGDPWRYSSMQQPGADVNWRMPTATDGKYEPDTSYVSVVDQYGNAFSATPSDGVTGAPIVDGLGIIISGRGMQSWTNRRHPSSIEPKKRPRLTPNPGMVIYGNRMVMPYGTPGLDVQPQAMVQFLTRFIDYGLDVQDAIERPRVATYSFPGSSDPHPYTPGLLKVEGRVGETVQRELSSRGHRVERWPEWTGLAGSLSAIRFDREHGHFYGGADPRRVAYAVGW